MAKNKGHLTGMTEYLKAQMQGHYWQSSPAGYLVGDYLMNGVRMAGLHMAGYTMAGYTTNHCSLWHFIEHKMSSIVAPVAVTDLGCTHYLKAAKFEHKTAWC